MAKNLVIYELERAGRISKEEGGLMRDVTMHPLNAQYGKALLRTGAARSNHSAAAMVFAQMAVAAENVPGPITTEIWQAAVLRAMVNAGASQAESYLVLAQLLEKHRNSRTAGRLV